MHWVRRGVPQDVLGRSRGRPWGTSSPSRGARGAPWLPGAVPVSPPGGQGGAGAAPESHWAAPVLPPGTPDRPGHTCKHENDKRRLHFYNHPVKQIKSLPVAGLKFVPRRELVLENASFPFFMGCFFVEPRLSARAVAARAANVFVAARRTS